MTRRLPETVDCDCNACGAVGTCRPDQPAPTGWYYVHEPGHDFRLGIGILACCQACRDILVWRQSK